VLWEGKTQSDEIGDPVTMLELIRLLRTLAGVGGQKSAQALQIDFCPPTPAPPTKTFVEWPQHMGPCHPAVPNIGDEHGRWPAQGTGFELCLVTLRDSMWPQ